MMPLDYITLCLYPDPTSAVFSGARAFFKRGKCEGRVNRCGAAEVIGPAQDLTSLRMCLIDIIAHCRATGIRLQVLYSFVPRADKEGKQIETEVAALTNGLFAHARRDLSRDGSVVLSYVGPTNDRR
jgi:hypothetical protein